MPHSINASAIKPIEKSSRQSPFVTLPGRFLFDPFRRLVLELFATHRIDRLVFVPPYCVWWRHVCISWRVFLIIRFPACVIQFLLFGMLWFPLSLLNSGVNVLNNRFFPYIIVGIYFHFSLSFFYVFVTVSASRRTHVGPKKQSELFVWAVRVSYDHFPCADVLGVSCRSIEAPWKEFYKINKYCSTHLKLIFAPHLKWKFGKCLERQHLVWWVIFHLDFSKIKRKM